MSSKHCRGNAVKRRLTHSGLSGALTDLTREARENSHDPRFEFPARWFYPQTGYGISG